MTHKARGAELRRLRRELACAGDRQIRQLVALVDAVSERGEADTLIAPLRPRLALLRPPRPLHLMRLLFMPLDPLVLPPSAWRPGAIGVPRASLRPLAGVVSAALGPLTASLTASMAGHSTAEHDIVAACGAQLWPVAAAVLRAACVPPGWTDACGLQDAAFAPLATAVAGLLAEGVALWRLSAEPGAPDEAGEARRLLANAASAGPQAFTMMLALLLIHLPDAGQLLQCADDLAHNSTDATRVAPDRALDFLLGVIETATEAPAQTAAPVDGLRRAALTLESLVRQSSSKPSRVARLERARRRLDDSCRQAFEQTAITLAPTPAANTEEVNSLEAGALHLRRGEAVGRRLGSAPFYDQMLRQTAERLGRTAGLAAIDRLRLAEILLGPDAALALFGMS